MTTILQLTLNGILLGGFYASMVLGFSLTWGVMGVINLAHGEFLMLGAFLAWLLFNPQRTDVAISLPGSEISLPVLALAGVWIFLALSFVSYRFGLRRLASRSGRGLISLVMGGAVTGVLYWVWRDVFSLAPIDPFVSIPAVMLVLFSFGYLLQKHLINRVVERPHLITLLITFGISVILTNLALLVFSGDPRQVILTYRPNVNVAGVTVPTTRTFVFGVALLIMLALHLFLQRTRTGKSIRAAAQHKMAARTVGIDIYETYALAFGISIALVGAAGAMISPLQAVWAVMGPPFTLKAFTITALGGLGRIQGAMLGGLVLGLAESFIGFYVGTGWGVATAFILLVLILILRPRGLLGGELPAEVQ
ncbi:MAG: branched-chain amino acid ABC transporter permease [Anaerolineae bacterium]